jgi:hypothetical protein
MFTAWEDRHLKMLPPWPALEHPTSAPSSTSGNTCSGLDLFVGLYIRTVKLIRGISIVTSTLWTFTGASSSSSSASSSSRDSSDEYPEIGANTCGKSAEDSHFILMVASNGDQSHNSSSGYPNIERSEMSGVQTPSAGLDRNLNPYFNVIQVQTIMEIIQGMTPDGSPLATLGSARG